MANLLAARATEIDVDYRSFLLLDGSYEGEMPGPAIQPLVESASGGLMMLSAASDHFAAVEVQWWDGAPEPVSTEWDDTVHRRFQITGEYLILEITGGGPKNEDPYIPVQFVGPTQAAVHCRGRAEAAQRYVDGEMWFHGVEQWLIQLWPDRAA